jgi:hypothetical protein
VPGIGHRYGLQPAMFRLFGITIRPESWMCSWMW